MSHLRPFLVALTLASALATDGKVIAKQQLDSLDSAGVPLVVSPMLTVPTTRASAAQLPNGASSISETYSNWVVDCRTANGHKQCRLLQIQIDSQTNRRVFEIELQMPEDGKVEGTILMPFGLQLTAGAVPKLDDKVLGDALRFLTCIQAGCLLPVSFPPIAVDEMKKGKILTIASLNLSDEVITFNVPLVGFAAAITRVAELGRWMPSNSSMNPWGGW